MTDPEIREEQKKGRPAHPKVAGRPTHWLPGVRGFTPSVLLPEATTWPDPTAVGLQELRLPSPSGLAGPRGSPVPALRVSRVAPTSHTAHRGATSAWTRHATGPAYPSGVISPGSPNARSPWVSSALSPEFPS